MKTTKACRKSWLKHLAVTLGKRCKLVNRHWGAVVFSTIGASGLSQLRATISHTGSDFHLIITCIPRDSQRNEEHAKVSSILTRSDLLALRAIIDRALAEN